jgi:hypothetical protein
MARRGKSDEKYMYGGDLNTSFFKSDTKTW